MMKDAHVPIRNINALPYHPDLPRTSVETNQKYADFDVIEMSNVGHFIMLEKPDEFNAKLPEAIEAVLAVSNK